MERNEALAVQQKEVALKEKEREWKRLQQQANIVLQGGLAPNNLPNEQAVLAVMLSARELALPPMLGLRELYVVHGKVGMSAKTMAALVRQQRAGWFEEQHEFDHEAREGFVWLKGHRVDGPVEDETYETTWDMDRAEPFMRQGGKIKPPWRNFPDQMLWNRAMSEVCRRLFSDIIGGLYLPEELGTTPTPSPGGGSGGGSDGKQQPPQVQAPTVDSVTAEAPEQNREPQAETSGGEAAEATPRDAGANAADPGDSSEAEKECPDPEGALRREWAGRDDWDRGMSQACLQLWRTGQLQEPYLADVKEYLREVPKEDATCIKGMSSETYKRLCAALLGEEDKGQGNPPESEEKPAGGGTAGKSPERRVIMPGDWHMHSTHRDFHSVATIETEGGFIDLYRHVQEGTRFLCSECGQQKEDYCEHLQAARKEIKEALDSYDH